MIEYHTPTFLRILVIGCLAICKRLLWGRLVLSCPYIVQDAVLVTTKHVVSNSSEKALYLPAQTVMTGTAWYRIVRLLAYVFVD